MENDKPIFPSSADANDMDTGLPYGKQPSAPAPSGSGFVPSPESFHAGQLPVGNYPANQAVLPYSQPSVQGGQPFNGSQTSGPVPPYAQPQYTQAGYNQPYNYPYATPGTLPPPKKNRTGLIVAIVILVLLLCSCCLVMMVTLGLLADSGSIDEIGHYDVGMSVLSNFNL